jgi:hypothetical protein
MSAKYEPLRLILDQAPPEESASFTFSELDQLIGGLPASAREHRSWWGNTFSHNRPHALAWMATGRRVAELRMGEAVVFSPADAPTEGAEVSRTSRGARAPEAILDGVAALSATLDRAGYGSIIEAVAAHTVFLHPHTVSQSSGGALFRLIRDPARRGQFEELPDGGRVLLDDNTGPTLAFLWSARRIKGRDVQFNHVWGEPRNLATYTALWNLCATPAFLAKTTDGSNHPEVVNLLRFRAFDLYGHLPHGEEPPAKPPGYDHLEWLAPPEPVEDLEALLRQRMCDAPKSRPAVSAREIGWLFGDGPDSTIPAP